MLRFKLKDSRDDHVHMRVRLPPQNPLVAAGRLLELLVEANDPLAQVCQQLKPAVALVAHCGSHRQAEQLRPPARAEEPHLLNRPSAQSQRPQTVLDLRPHPDEAVAVAKQPQYLPALRRRAMHARELSLEEQIKDQLGVTPVVLLPPLGPAADLGCVAESHLRAEFSEQLLEPDAVAAGL